MDSPGSTRLDLRSKDNAVHVQDPATNYGGTEQLATPEHYEQPVREDDAASLCVYTGTL